MCFGFVNSMIGVNCYCFIVTCSNVIGDYKMHLSKKGRVITVG